MGKTIIIPEYARHSGILIEWIKTARRLDISGWYDSFVGIEGNSFTLAEFFERLGITRMDCNKALKELEERKEAGDG